MKSIAIIPARGGSKGIPRKNIKLLNGKPLITYTIKQALLANFIDRVIVSTDDMEIADISINTGAEVIIRPKDISTDTSSSELALLNVINYLEKEQQYKPDIITFLQCTSPLTNAEDIDGTIKLLIDKNLDTCFAVTKFDYFLWEEKNGEVIGINHDKSFRLMRQQRTSQFIETGAVYVMKTDGFLNKKFRFFGNMGYYIMPKERVLEIDEPIDFKIAELLIKENN
jgi:N-acylneuraminate cytidylyltransferase